MIFHDYKQLYLQININNFKGIRTLVSYNDIPPYAYIIEKGKLPITALRNNDYKDKA